MAPSPEQFVYKLYTASDADEMARLLGEVFAQSDQPAGAVGLTPFESEAFVRLFCAKPETQRLTIVARSAETREMIGALLAEDLASAPPEGMDRVSAKFDPILNILGRFDADYRAGRSGKLLHRFLLFLHIVKVRKRDVRPGKFLHLFLLGVAQQFVGQGVVRQLVAECLANGARRGYRVAVTTATSKTSQQIFRKQGFVKRVRIAEHGGPILMDKRLASPPKSLADILAEELDDAKLGPEYTQELPVAEKQARLKAVYQRIHKEQRSALCLSGGGIRSATFGLGILQGLARCGLLGKFDYLSTVSGGGYIGSWLSAWIKNKNNPQEGMQEVVNELNHAPDSTLGPEPPPIRHLREFSNYLTPKTGLMSVDFWTLIATFIRNMFLNWLVLISCLAAAMIIPRLYLALIRLEPTWRDWNAPVEQYWNIRLTIVLAVGFALIAIAMAYAIIDVPSTGNLRYSQRLFLWFRQFPLFLASLILAAWWAVYRNVHGSEPFQSQEWLPWFVGFTVLSYLSGGVLATVFLFFHESGRKGWPRWPGRRSLLRLATIVLTAVFAGFCLWVVATQLFLGPPSGREFELKSECEAILIPSLQEVRLSSGTQVEKILEVPVPPTARPTATATATPTAPLPLKNEYAFTTGWKANQIRTGQEMTIRGGDHALFATEDLDALKPIPVPAPAIHALKYVCFAPVLFLAVLLLVNFLFTGLASKVTKDEDREWWGRSAAWILITIFGWIVFNVMDLGGAQAIAATKNRLQVFLGSPQLTEPAQAILGAFGGVTGIAGALLVLQHKLGHKLGQKRSFQWLLVVVAVVFFLLLSIVISWVVLLIRSRMQSAANWFYHESAPALSFLSLMPAWPPWRVELLVAFILTTALVSFGILMGFLIDTNSFSLHATYRNRLIRAYLAASRIEDTRRENPFTGFDAKDDFELHELCSQKPLHVINATLNLVKGEELAWQERQAESFTMSPLHCGSSRVGYRPSAEYGKGISLGTAFAISGAAANPNMGYHSSPVVRFLMTLFNVRLGWWLGNPGKSGDKTWRQRGPWFSVGPLFSEAMGNTTDSYKYVNLSDGGHFENLGLYEMVLRRCHYIVVSDAGEDPECSFADLGDAVRKIRIDFGIPIDFEPMTIYPRSAIRALKRDRQEGHNCAIGRIQYSAVDDSTAPDGIILYIKPACYGDEPRDIYEYFKRSVTFPHESTADQFFSESQFESYRMLGAHTMEKLCTGCAGDFREFVEKTFTEHLRTRKPKWLEELFAAEDREQRSRTSRSWLPWR